MEVAGSVDSGGILESALVDQKMRSDRHKSNFDALKAQHLSLQEVSQSLFSIVRELCITLVIGLQRFQSLRLEHNALSDSYDRLHQKSHEIIQKLQSERDDKIIECENLKKQVME